MGLFDRYYMRGTPPQFFNRRDGMSMIWKLIGINAAVYMLVLLTPGEIIRFAGGGAIQTPGKVFEMLALTSGGIQSFHAYKLITAGFLHQDFWHIVFNMWGLYIFGELVSCHLSGRRILWLYIIGAVSGNLLFLIFNWHSAYMLCGASGAVYAVMMAAAMLEPNRRFAMLFFPMFPVKTSTLVVCFTVLELLQQIGGAGGDIAHLAHLGGFLGGLIYMKYLSCFRGVIPSWDPLKMVKTAGGHRPSGGFRPEQYRASDWGPQGDFRKNTPVSQRELDRLLDKISENGINSLSDEELAALRRARDEMKRQGR